MRNIEYNDMGFQYHAIRRNTFDSIEQALNLFCYNKIWIQQNGKNEIENWK